jgi:hypothetical protein
MSRCVRAQEKVGVVKVKSIGSCAALAALSVAMQAFGGFSKEAFRNPECIYSPAYFWMWNARLEPGLLKSQLDDMHAHGMRSVCIHPFPRDFRPGRLQSEMSPEYLTDEYFLVFSNVVDHAASLGMNVWLYDEGGWPSGGACGRVAAADAEGRYRKRIIGYGEGSGPLEVRAVPYGTGRANYPSVIEKGATESFIRVTHERYAKYVGRHFGKAIRFTFMDEPYLPKDSSGFNLGWCTDFAEVFRASKGYDIMPYVERLIDRKQSPDPSTIKARLDYFDVMGDLFVSRFMDPIRRWDHRHGLLSSGHVDGEDMPEAAVRYGYGALLRTYRAMDIPGVDVIWRQIFPEAQGTVARTAPFPRYASSVAHQKGGMLAMSESFGIFGNSFTPDQMKWVVDYQMLRGVNLFVFGYYSVSNAKQWMLLFEPHSGPVAPWWDMEKPYFEYIARTGSLLADGAPASEIAVFFDSRAFWAGGAEAVSAGEMHYAVSAALDKMNCEYEFVDDDAIAAAEIRDGRLNVGKMSYSTLVLPTSKWMREDARAKVETFRSQGGKVLSPDTLSAAKPVCRIHGRYSGMFRAAKRVNGGETLYFVVNEGSWPLDGMRIEFEEPGEVVHADTGSGDFAAVNRAADGTISWDFPPYGSALFIVGAKADRPAPPRFDSASRTVRTLSDGWKVRRTASHALGEDDFEIAAIEEPPVDAAPGDWRALFGESFSGKAVYECAFDGERQGKALLDLGKVGWSCSVKLNGRELQPKFFGPFRWIVDLKKGRNELQVTVANTLANASSDVKRRGKVAAKYPPSMSYEPKHVVYDRENHESGLIGPVTLTTE